MLSCISRLILASLREPLGTLQKPQNFVKSGTLPNMLNIHFCDNCKNNLESWYKCNECNDFDLCVTCYPSFKHNPEHTFNFCKRYSGTGQIQRLQEHRSIQEIFYINLDSAKDRKERF